MSCLDLLSFQDEFNEYSDGERTGVPVRALQGEGSDYYQY